MDHIAGRLAAASLSSDDPSAAAAGRDGGVGNLRGIMSAVERAEGTIRDQFEETNRLKEELMHKTRLLQMIREDATSQASFGGASQEIRASVDTGSSANPQSTSVLHQNGISGSGAEPQMHERMNHKYPDGSQANGAFRRSSGEPAAVDNGGRSHSQFSTPSSRSLSPTRHRKEGDYDSRINLAGEGLMPVSEMNSNISRKQDLTVKVKEHEEEIAQLRKHLDNYLVKEAKILNDKYTLEKRIAYMRVAFDQQQQDLVDAASKALSYRQDIIEENVRLTYALQAAHQERSTFISSLLPLLSEYESLRPSVLDAQSIVSSLKVLFRHLQEQLMISEEKVQESQYQITPWQTELTNTTSLPVQSPNNPLGKALSKSSLDIVPQTAYPHVQSPISSPVQGRGNWSVIANKNRQVIPSEVPARNIDHDYRGRTSLSSSNQFRSDVSAQASQHDSHAAEFDFDTQNQNPPFKGLSRSDVLDDSAVAEAQHVRETSAQWGSGDSPNLASGLEEATPSYPYLPTVPEEPGSSFSEAAEDDPLPGIKGLRITGEAFPGRELQASGYSTDGTTSCNFEWVRHLDDGSVKFIEGARQPNYLVTADDVDTLLVIEVQPLDDRKRKGEVVKVYANDQAKITCDPETKELIKKTLEAGQVSYQVQLPQVRFLDMWEPAVLAIKREGYSIKCNGQHGVVLTEKFQQATAIRISPGYKRATEFVIVSADGHEYNLQPAENTPPRDTIVLVLRSFRNMSKSGLSFPSDVLDGSVGAEAQHVRETSAQWGSGDSPNLASGLEEANRSYPYLPMLPKDSGPSLEDDLLPGIEGLQITGEAFIGQELQAYGYSINGTTNCNFKWARRLDDGSIKYIEGAREPNYLVTADDVDTLLAIEVQPLDDRKRKGEVVKVFANNQEKITCDPETKELIKKTLETGQVSYQVQLPQVRFLDMWEPAVLAIKREGYSIKCNGQPGVVLAESFQQATAINISPGHERKTEFVIVSADGHEYNLQPAENTLPRDTIVLVLRLFRSMAVAKRRGRKKASFSSRSF